MAPPRRRIYLDHHATTRVDPRVLEAMLPYFCEKFGNAASRTHAFGWEAEEAVERARVQTAASLGAQPEEIVFTSGATESNNLALKGAALANARNGRRLITVQTEHKAVLDCAAWLERAGFAVTRLGVNAEGLLELDALAAALTADTILVSVMAANNEIGVLQPLAEIGRLCRERGVIFHTDAAQAVGKIPLDVEQLHVDLLSLSAHKFYGPKGIGALYVRRRKPRVRLEAQMDGGGHEHGLRSGTLNVPAIVGMGRALEIAQREGAAEARRILELRETLRRGLLESLPGIRINGSLERRLPGNLNVSFEQVEGELLLMALNDLALSSGSACTSASPQPSHVLQALGLPDNLIHASLRFGIGRENTAQEIEYALARVTEEVRRLREMNPQPAGISG